LTIATVILQKKFDGMQIFNWLTALKLSNSPPLPLRGADLPLAALKKAVGKTAIIEKLSMQIINVGRHT
jgi:hypothetical protein